MGIYSDLATSPAKQTASDTKKPKRKGAMPAMPNSDAPIERPSARTVARTPVRPKNRIRVRYAFEFYQDQIVRLKEMRRSSIINDDDEEFSMSEYVRQALDEKLSQD